MDTIFKRDFDHSGIHGHVENPRSILHALFDRWVLPGQPFVGIAGPVPLRLALRSKSINFYANGQSVAELKVRKGEPRIKVARNYLERAPISVSAIPKGADYLSIEGDRLLLDDPSRLLEHIVQRSEKHRSKEKCFVEHLQARNANMLEVEMALPGDHRVLKEVRDSNGNVRMKKVAPRMDAVVLHLLEDDQPTIDFWEAKLATNGELRCEEGRSPHLFEQLKSYTRWFHLPDRLAQAKDAMRLSGAILGELADRSGKSGPAGELWRALEKRVPTINPFPGVVIGDYDPECTSFSRFERQAHTFRQNGHHARLTAAGITVRSVAGFDCEQGLFDRPLQGTRL